MKKTILRETKTNPADNRLVYAISSSESDLKICLKINQKLSINLTLEQNYKLTIRGRQIPFRCYHYEFDEGIEKYDLFVNRTETEYLFPELKKIDFVLVVYSEGNIETLERQLGEFKGAPEFNVFYKVDPSSLKSLKRIII